MGMNSIKITPLTQRQDVGSNPYTFRELKREPSSLKP